MARDWPSPQNFPDLLRQQEKRLQHQERRSSAGIRNLLGPGLSPRAVKIMDWNSEVATFNGFFHSGVGALNTPDSLVEWTGQTISKDDGTGLQQVWSTAGTGTVHYARTYEPSPLGNGISVFQPWRKTGTLVDSAGNILAQVSDQGDATFRDIYSEGTIYLDRGDQYDGQVLSDYLAQFPRGIITAGNRDMSGTTLPQGLNHILTLAFDLSTPRALLVSYSGQTDSTLADAKLEYDLSWTTLPLGTTDPVPEPTRNAGFTRVPGVPDHYDYLRVAGNDLTVNASWRVREMPAGRHKIALFYDAKDADHVARAAANTPGFQMSVIDMGLPTTINAAYWTGSAPVPTTTYTATFEATDTKWWSGGHTFKGAGDSQFFGNSPSTSEGNRKSVIWFNKDNITATLSGATITKVELYLYVFDGGANNKIAIGRHTDTTPSSNQYGDVSGVNKQIGPTFDGWDEGTGKYVELTDTQLTNWQGDLGGYIIGPQSSDSADYAGGYRGATHSLKPKLRITYTKQSFGRVVI